MRFFLFKFSSLEDKTDDLLPIQFVTTSGREIGKGFVRYLPTMKQGASVGLPGMRADHKWGIFNNWGSPGPGLEGQNTLNVHSRLVSQVRWHLGQPRHSTKVSSLGLPVKSENISVFLLTQTWPRGTSVVKYPSFVVSPHLWSANWGARVLRSN